MILHRDKIEGLALYGYPGIFLLTLLSYSTVVVPIPVLALVFAMGSIYNPILVAFSASTGGSIGELSGYMVGYSGQEIIHDNKYYLKFKNIIEKHLFISILVLTLIPGPFFDIGGVSAGLMKMPFKKFLLAVWIGITIKMLVATHLGNYIL